MAELCRSLEKKYGLQEVLSPRAFLSPKERLLPRQIEKILNQKELSARKNTGDEKNRNKDHQSVATSFNTDNKNKENQSYTPDRTAEEFAKQNLGLLGQLMNSEYTEDYVDPEFERMLRKKKKKSSLRR
ncbi:hypothetical protein D3C72_1789790 [compost metagenome]